MRNRLTIAAIVLLALLTSHLLRAQAPATQSLAPPQWQIDAGGKMAFDVASVKQNTSGMPGDPLYSNVPLGATAAFTPTGGLFRAVHLTLVQSYIPFAYKLTNNQILVLESQPQLPKWVNENRFDIEARAGANTTKDQMRLMMQALLADRFKMVAHLEKRQLPVYALVLEKPGKTGSQLRPYPDGSPCSSTPPQPSARNSTAQPTATVTGGFPAFCGDIGGNLVQMTPNAPGRLRFGARNVSMEVFVTMLARYFPTVGSLDRPVLDQTGLSGAFDITIEFTPEFNGTPPPDFDPSGPTLRDALKDQLGLKLESQTGPVDVLVIDHVEEPTPN